MHKSGGTVALFTPRSVCGTIFFCEKLNHILKGNQTYEMDGT